MIEDYLQMLLQMVEYTPDVFFPSPAFPIAFRAAMVALTVVHTDIIFAALDLIRNVITHECLSPPSTAPPPPKFPLYAAAIRPVIQKEGLELTGYLLTGLVGDFPEESPPVVVTIFRVLAALWPTELLSWLSAVLQQVPSTAVPDQIKVQFIADMDRCVMDSNAWGCSRGLTNVYSAVQSAEYDRVKRAILSLHRASRKARDRRRVAALDM